MDEPVGGLGPEARGTVADQAFDRVGHPTAPKLDELA